MLVNSEDGYAIETMDYDSKGDVIKRSYLDSNRHPCNHNKRNWATAKISEIQNEIRTDYYSYNNSLICSEIEILNADYQTIELKYINRYGRLIEMSDNYGFGTMDGMTRFWIIESFLRNRISMNDSQKFNIIPETFARRYIVYDEFSEVKEERYYDKGDNCYFKIRYNRESDIAKVQSFVTDKDGKEVSIGRME